MNNTTVGMPPVVNEQTRRLILGSMPGEESLRMQQYYAKSTNDFWKIVGHCIGENLVALTYSQKIAKLLANRIGLWDVYSHCERLGSLDADIRNGKLNDFEKLRRDYPEVNTLLLNGKEAGASAPVLGNLGFQVVVLPSTSGANRKNMAGRENQWRVALRPSSGIVTRE